MVEQGSTLTYVLQYDYVYTTVFRSGSLIGSGRIAEYANPLFWDSTAFRANVINRRARELARWDLENLALFERIDLAAITGGNRDLMEMIKTDSGWIAVAQHDALGLVFADLTPELALRRSFFASGIYLNGTGYPLAVGRTDPDGGVTVAALSGPYWGDRILHIVYAAPDSSSVSQSQAQLAESGSEYRIRMTFDHIVVLNGEKAYRIGVVHGVIAETADATPAAYDSDRMRLDFGLNGTILAAGPINSLDNAGRLRVEAIRCEPGSSATAAVFTADAVLPRGWNPELSSADDWLPIASYLSVASVETRPSSSGFISVVLFEYFAVNAGVQDQTGRQCYQYSGLERKLLGVSKTGNGFRSDIKPLANAEVSAQPDSLPGALSAVWLKNWNRLTFHGSSGFAYIDISGEAAGKRLADLSIGAGIAILSVDDTRRNLTLNDYNLQGAIVSTDSASLAFDFILSRVNSIIDPPGFALEFASLDAATGRDVYRYRFTAADSLAPSADLRPTLTTIGGTRFDSILRVDADGSFTTVRSGSLYRYLADGSLTRYAPPDYSYQDDLAKLRRLRLRLLDGSLATVMDREYEEGWPLGVLADGENIYIIIAKGDIKTFSRRYDPSYTL